MGGLCLQIIEEVGLSTNRLNDIPLRLIIAAESIFYKSAIFRVFPGLSLDGH